MVRISKTFQINDYLSNYRRIFITIKKIQNIKFKYSKHSSMKQMFGKDFIKYSWITVVILIFLCFLPFLLTHHGPKLLDFSHTGEIGDTIGGTMSPFVAIFAAILTFLAFWVQYNANEQQRHDIALERFESNLFQLISVQEEITNNLTYYLSQNSTTNDILKGRRIFEFLYLERRLDWQKGIRGSIEHEGIKVIENDKSLGCLDHYFRHLYRIFKYIDDEKKLELTKKEKYEDTSIVRSMLSEYELLILFYNCLAINSNHSFKELIEDYAILNNIRCDHLALIEEQNYYKELLKSDSYIVKNLPPQNLYTKSAFVFSDK